VPAAGGTVAMTGGAGCCAAVLTTGATAKMRMSTGLLHRAATDAIPASLLVLIIPTCIKTSAESTAAASATLTL
jgi:hypothetical protein